MGSILYAAVLVLAAGDPEASAMPPAALSAAACLPGATGACRCMGDRWRATSPNFAIECRHAGHDAREVAELCEQWRQRLAKYWGLESASPWTPACQIVVHGDGRSYVAAVGNGAWQTFGSSELVFGAGGRIARRRIDLRGDSPHGLATLPHELTHLIAADLLGRRQPPRWADEGMAILADSAEKQRLHQRDLADSVARGAVFRLSDLVGMEQYPAPTWIPLFYGQSASLTAYLVRRAAPGDFVRFLKIAHRQGYERAAQEVYGVASLAELEQQWRAARQAEHTPLVVTLALSPQAASE